MEESSISFTNPSCSNAQFDPNMVQALAQEIMQLLKGKQVEQQSDNMHSFAHLAGNISSSISFHFDKCCDMQNSYVGSWIVGTGASNHMTSDLT